MTDPSPPMIQKLRLQPWMVAGAACRAGGAQRSGGSADRTRTKSKCRVAQGDRGGARCRFWRLKGGTHDRNRRSEVSADEALALAKVRKIKGFYLHVIEYVLIVAFLAILNVFRDSRRLWFAWAAIPWGLVLALHGLPVFDKIPFLNGASRPRSQRPAHRYSFRPRYFST